jgi:hypothetical protein
MTQPAIIRFFDNLNFASLFPSSKLAGGPCLDDAVEMLAEELSEDPARL